MSIHPQPSRMWHVCNKTTGCTALKTFKIVKIIFDSISSSMGVNFWLHEIKGRVSPYTCLCWFRRDKVLSLIMQVIDECGDGGECTKL